MRGCQPYPSRGAPVAANRCRTSRARGSRSAIVAATKTIAVSDPDLGQRATKVSTATERERRVPAAHSVTDCGSALRRSSASMRVERRNLLAQPPDAAQPGTRNHRVRVIQEHGAVTSLTTHRFVRASAGITCRRPVQPFQAGPRHGRPAHANPATAEKSAVQTFYIAGHQHRVTLPGFGKYVESRIAGSSAKTLMGVGDDPRFRTLFQALIVVPYSYLRQKRAGAIAAKLPRSGAQARTWTHPKARNQNHFLICSPVA